MNRLLTHYKTISSYDLITKYNYKNSFQIPKIKKISINLSSTNLAFEKKKIIPFLLLLELISGQKGTINISKKNKINLKIKKGMVMGCKVTLNESNSYKFLENLILFIFPNINNFKGFSLNKKSATELSFKIDNVLNFLELENEFLNFSKMPKLDLTLHIKTQTIEETNCLLTSLNFPILLKV